MNHLPLLAVAAFAATGIAQSQTLMVTFSQTETSLSGSGGTVLQTLRPNEVHQVEYIGPCTSVSAEKWLPRTALHVRGGDENGDGQFFRPNLFGSIDALLSIQDFVAPVPFSNQATVFWSPSASLGPAVSLPPFGPGDVGRINAAGQAERFMTQQLFNQSLGLPPAYPIDIDAIAWHPSWGIFYSVDVDVVATTACGPMLVQDGDVLCIPPSAYTLGSDFLVTAVLPNSSLVAYSESDMDAMTVAAGVTDRFGVCLSSVGDVESLEIDQWGPVSTIVPCAGTVIEVPTLLYSSENGTGGSVLETAFGGQIRNSTCGPIGTACGFGPTLGLQIGIQPFSGNIGAPSYVNALSNTRACRFVLEPVDHVMTVPLGAPLGANMIDYHNPFPLSVAFIELTAPPLPFSFPAWPFSPNCYPDVYTPSLTFWAVMGPGFGSFPMVGIPPAWSGKVLYQAVELGGNWDLSTPTVVDVN